MLHLNSDNRVHVSWCGAAAQLNFQNMKRLQRALLEAGISALPCKASTQYMTFCEIGSLLPAVRDSYSRRRVGTPQQLGPELKTMPLMRPIRCVLGGSYSPCNYRLNFSRVLVAADNRSA